MQEHELAGGEFVPHQFIGHAIFFATVWRHGGLIPSLADQDRCAQLRRPMDMIVHGWSTRRFQAKQQ